MTYGPTRRIVLYERFGCVDGDAQPRSRHRSRLRCHRRGGRSCAHASPRNRRDVGAGLMPAARERRSLPHAYALRIDSGIWF